MNTPEEESRLRIFVSYGHDEYSIFAERLVEELKKRGYEVWFDKECLRTGKAFDDKLEEGLNWIADYRDRGRLVLIMTPHSVRRPEGYCLNEIAKAISDGVPIVPVMLISTSPPLSIYRLQWLDFRLSWNGSALNEDYLSTGFERICKILEENSLDKEGVMHSLHDQLSPLDFNADLKSKIYQRWFTGREWVFDKINEWIDNQEASRVLCIVGLPGIGKTTVAIQLIQKLSNIIAYHLCQLGNNEKSSPHKMICTIAYHLSAQIPEYKDRLAHIRIEKEKERCNDIALFDVLIVQPLSHVSISPEKPMIILIDALDEASNGQKNVIANFIASEFNKLPRWLRIIITTRPNREVLTPLRVFHPWELKSESKENLQDIADYIDLRLNLFKDSDSYEKTKSIIEKHANGIFLYAFVVCNEIEEGKLSFENPENFPTSMGDLYFRFFQLHFEDINKYRKHIRPPLQLIISACEPLTRNQIASFLTWDIDNVNDWLQAMGSLLLVNSDDQVLPFHASLFDWLVREENSFLFFVDKNLGHAIFCQGDMLHSVCRKYLLKFLPVHLISSANQGKFVDLFITPEFMDLRKEEFPTFLFLKYYFSELSLFYETYPKQMLKIFDSHEFKQIVLDYYSYMFDKEYYIKLRNVGFSGYLSQIDVSQLTTEFKIALISYYYVNHKIDEAIRFDMSELDISKLEYLEPLMLGNYGLAFNIIGVCNRIAGEFDKAYKYISTAIKINQLLKNEVAESVIEANLARVYQMDLDFKMSENILKHGISLIEKQNFDKTLYDDVFKLIHMHNGATYILAELYLNTNRPDQAYECLKTIESLYVDPEYRDRYWPRCLYSIAIYHLLKGNLMEANVYLSEAESVSCHNDRMKSVRIIYQWIKSTKDGDTNFLEKTKLDCEEVMSRFVSNYQVENYAESLALYKHICESLNCDVSLDNILPVEKFNKWINYKYNWLTNMINLSGIA